MQKAKKTNVIRGRDMVSPIDARDYEPVDGSWIRSGNLCFVSMTKFTVYRYGKDILSMVIRQRHEGPASSHQTVPFINSFAKDFSQEMDVFVEQLEIIFFASRICSKSLFFSGYIVIQVQ